MQIKNSLLDDLAKTVTGAMGGVSNLKDGADDIVKAHIEKALQDCDVVSHQEHIVLKKMVEKVIVENTDLKQRLEVLEKQVKGAKQ